MHDSPGMTASRFVQSLPDDALRQFIPAEVLSFLTAIFGQSPSGADLHTLANTLVDLKALLRDAESRRLVLDLLPDLKRVELEIRLEPTSLDAPHSSWTARDSRILDDFFGILEEHLPQSELVDGGLIEPFHGLFDHQRRTVAALLPHLQGDNRRAILHLPTGVGKTRTAMHVVSEFLRNEEPGLVVWLSSGRELLDQAVEAFVNAWRHLGNRPVRVERLWGQYSPDLKNFNDGFLAIGLAKAWSMMSSSDSSWAAELAPRVRLVVFDEAHQSVAPTYRQVVEDLTLDHKSSLLGLTATPGRTWADIDADNVLAEFYSYTKVGLTGLGENPVQWLTERDYLARPSFRNIFVDGGLSISDHDRTRIARSLDIPKDVLDQVGLSAQYATAVLEVIEQLLRDGHQRILVFAATVGHARLLAAVLAVRGIRSWVVTGATEARERQRTTRAFAQGDGEPMVLVNFGVLTTGFDAPSLSAVVIARPTTSLVLYSQMVGRGIRGLRAGGTKACDILTVVDPSLPGFESVAAAFTNWEDVWHV